METKKWPLESFLFFPDQTPNAGPAQPKHIIKEPPVAVAAEKDTPD